MGSLFLVRIFNWKNKKVCVFSHILKSINYVLHGSVDTISHKNEMNHLPLLMLNLIPLDLKVALLLLKAFFCSRNSIYHLKCAKSSLKYKMTEIKDVN